MGLTATAMDLLTQLRPWESVLCLSYPDVVIPAEGIRELYPITQTTNHGARHGVGYELPETTELLTLMGAKSVRYVDIICERGVEEICDLNIPQDLGKHDLVIDPGTTEHCFNVGQAIVNAASAVKVGGHIFHGVPVSMVNHGFWNFSPTALFDFYTQNGFKVVGQWYSNDDELFECPPVARNTVRPETGMIFIARRELDSPILWPMQSKYKAAMEKHYQGRMHNKVTASL